MAWVLFVIHWGVFAVGAILLVLMGAALILDGVMRNQYRGASSYRRDERI